MQTTWERSIADSVRGPAADPMAEDGRLLAATARTSAPIAPRLLLDSSVRTTVNRIDTDSASSTRPAFSRDRLPVRELTPVQMSATPIAVDRFIIQPVPRDNIVYVAPTEVALVAFSLTLRRTVQPDRSVSITGGSASFSLSTYAPDTMASISRLSKDWETALVRNNIAARPWIYRPETRQGFSVSLELPAGIAASNPLVFVSPGAGVASVTVELTELGALSWKQALETGAGSSIPGIFRVSSNSLGIEGVMMRLLRRTMDTTVGRLLSGRSATDIRFLDPQQTIQARLIVVTNDLVNQMSVGLRSLQGQAPSSQVFGPAGGQVELSISAQDIDAVTVDWSAQVALTPLGWPSIPASGTLDLSNSWTDMIKPDSWIASYTVMVISVDERGQAQATTPPAGAPPPVQGVLNFTAPYLPNGFINSSFQADYFRPINVSLPRFPGQSFGDLMLTIFATRDRLGGTRSRKLSPDELNVIVLVYPDSRVEIRTGRDALAETSTASDMLQLLESF